MNEELNMAEWDLFYEGKDLRDKVMDESLKQFVVIELATEELMKYDPEKAKDIRETFGRGTISTAALMEHTIKRQRQCILNMMANEIRKEIHPEDPYLIAFENSIGRLREELKK